MSAAKTTFQIPTKPHDRIEILAMAAGICKSVNKDGTEGCRLCDPNSRCQQTSFFIGQAYEALNHVNILSGK